MCPVGLGWVGLCEGLEAMGADAMFHNILYRSSLLLILDNNSIAALATAAVESSGRLLPGTQEGDRHAAWTGLRRQYTVRVHTRQLALSRL